MAESLAHISLSFGGSGKPNCFVKRIFVCLDHRYSHEGGTLTFLLVIYPSHVHLSPGLVSLLPTDGTGSAVLHRCIPESLR